MTFRYFTYLHRTADAGRIFYVGKGTRDRERTPSGRSEYWNRIAAKHGYVPEIVARWASEEEAFEHERFLISTFKEMGIELCNLTVGGEGASGCVQSEETKRKRNEKLRGRRKSPETIARMKAAQAGKVISEEQRRKLSTLWRGKKVGALNPTAKRCMCVETGVVFETYSMAGDWLKSLGHQKASFKNISSAISGEKKTAYGYRWVAA